MDIKVSGMFFSCICLLLSAYYKRFSAISSNIRKFCSSENRDLTQIAIFRKRLYFIKKFQILGVLSIFLISLSTFFNLFNFNKISELLFLFGIFIFLVSLIFVLIDINYSLKALENNLMKGDE